ncbi:MAG: sugar phosphate isomerase/epimerase [Oscillospiraceae bacterium]|nr:sugar phosphate isomerase/epimerase [Oscillospiraceae bacterium]
MIGVGLQLYSIRDDKTDLLTKLGLVAAMGYKGIEFASFDELPAKAIKARLGELGLTPIGSHQGIDLLDASKADKALEYHAEVGCGYIAIPWAKYEGEEAVKAAAERINEVGRKAAGMGIRYLYHNHNHEFERIGGRYVLDLIMENTDPKYFGLQLDTYWVQYAGVDVVGYMKGVKGRLALIHQKDMKPGEAMEICEVGNGIMDVGAITRLGDEYGIPWTIVEQDRCVDYAPLECVRISAETFRRLGYLA